MSFRSELKKAPRTIYRIVALPFFLIATPFLRLFKIRFLKVTLLDRIGHLVTEIDCYLKEVAMGRWPREHLVLLMTQKPANPYFLECLPKEITVVRNPLLAFLLQPFERIPFVSHSTANYVAPVATTADVFEVYSSWGDRPPLLSLPEGGISLGEAELRRMGLPRGAWFVCVHVREFGYTPSYDVSFSYRDSSIDSYRPAMEQIVSRGGWCIRMGHPSGNKIDPPTDGVIDYAHSDFRSPFMDIFLTARCRFFLGTTSGLGYVAPAFGARFAGANMTPIASAFALNAKDISIPKLIRERSGRVLTFDEVMRSLGGQRELAFYDERGLTFVDNSPEEIRELVVEMLDRLEGTATYDADDEELQWRFHSLIRPGHYAYGAASRIGRDFLRRHVALMA